MNPFIKAARQAFIAVSFIFAALSFTACNGDDPEPDPDSSIAEQTVLMYLPQSGNLYSYFISNIEEFENAIVENGGLHGKKFMIFISATTDKTAAKNYLIEVTYNNNACKHDTLRAYTFNELDYTTAEGLTSLLNDVKQLAPAYDYAMIIGSHAMGWLPVEQASRSRAAVNCNALMESPKTRYFGAANDKDYQTDITALAEGIENAGIKMNYIVFDDCYMANIETVYEMRNATEYFIASTCEMMARGIPYHKIGRYLLNNDYADFCNGFYDFYISYSDPYGTMSVVDCSQAESMAQIMKEINVAYPDGISSVLLREIQSLDGCTPTIFFDFGDYVDKLCTDEELLARFNTQLDKLVPYKAHTPYFAAYIESSIGITKSINTFSGLTVSDPSNNTSWGVKTSKLDTAWYEATHQ